MLQEVVHVSRLLNYLTVFALTYSFYVVFTGASTSFSLALGALASAAITVFATPLLISRELRLADVVRAAYLVAYYMYYMAVAEVEAHVGITRTVLSRRIRISPAIVEVPYYVRTSFGMTLIAGSITNTPGTVVVQVDTAGRVLYVHWLKAVTYRPEEARRYISEKFEEFAAKIFG
jgi:multicomponent Na+:H+ antiporter subunit E